MTMSGAGIIGGNRLDARNLVIGALADRAGSLLHAAGPDELIVTGAVPLMTAVLLDGLLVRQRRGWWRVGFDGILLVAAAM